VRPVTLRWLSKKCKGRARGTPLADANKLRCPRRLLFAPDALYPSAGFFGPHRVPGIVSLSLVLSVLVPVKSLIFLQCALHDVAHVG
jgi:hypothetical protein